MGKIVELQLGLDPAKKERSKVVPMPQLLSTFKDNLEKSLPKDHQQSSSMKPIVGSNDIGECGIGDFGFFSTIYECSVKHWGLRTKPDDWWQTILRHVWIEVSRCSNEKVVRDHILKKQQTFFIFNHTDPAVKNSPLTLDVSDDLSFPYGLQKSYNHEKFFARLSNAIQSNIMNKTYYDSIGGKFSTSGPTEQILANMTFLSPVPEYSNYCLKMAYGIPYIDMQGSEADWKLLREKVLCLKKFMIPINEILKLTNWWEKIEVVCNKLLETYTAEVDKKWWSNILTTSEPTYPVQPCTIKYDGWFITDVLARKVSTCPKFSSSIASIPLEVSNNGKKERAEFVSGIAGIIVHDSGEIPAVEARHGWSLFVGQESEWLYQNHLVIRDRSNTK